MQKLGLNQSMLQKLSPQQIQYIKLLQITTAELEGRIKEELEENPALEEGQDDADEPADDNNEADFEEEDDFNDEKEDISLDEYLQDDYAGYKMQGDGGGEEENRELPIPKRDSLTETLMMQLGFLRLNDREQAIGRQIIGSLDDDGYLRRDLDALANDLAFGQNIEVDEDELLNVLSKIQEFDPPGIAARDLQECLLIQLSRRENETEAINNAIRMLKECFEEFTKKHFEKIQKKLELDEESMSEAFNAITRLNPKPGGTDAGSGPSRYLIPDFILSGNEGKPILSLNSRNAPELRISRSYAEMFDTYEKSNKKDKNLKQTVSFVKQKLDAAKWFIDAVKQRRHTLLHTMQAIIDFQYEYFMDGDESKLRPMILKDIADKIDMDISTVSRIANSKTIQTDFGIFPIKYFFSEGITTDSGEDVSNKEIKALVKEMIEHEDKKKPLSDEKLEKMLKLKGYGIARRTVAKYREQLNIPVARLRKEI